jgi:UDP-2-acetamido-3-amino-2,3-dideoxy-glucuronate N-acetyltransferase
MSRHGHLLNDSNVAGIYTCPESGLRYTETDPGVLKCMDIDEETPLPKDMAIGKNFYDELKHR